MRPTPGVAVTPGVCITSRVRAHALEEEPGVTRVPGIGHDCRRWNCSARNCKCPVCDCDDCLIRHLKATFDAVELDA